MTRHLSMLRSYTAADAFTIANATCGTICIFLCLDYIAADNRRLLRTRRISAVLHHDLRADMRRACRLLLQARGVLPGSPASVPSQIQVVTPFNEPSTLLVDRD